MPDEAVTALPDRGTRLTPGTAPGITPGTAPGSSYRSGQQRSATRRLAGAVRRSLRRLAVAAADLAAPFGSYGPTSSNVPYVPGVVFGGLRNSRLGRFLRRHPTAVDLGFTLLLGLAAVPGVAHAPRNKVLAVVLCVLALLPLVWRRRQPVLVLAACCGVALIQYLLDTVGEGDVSVLVGFYTVAAMCRRWVTFLFAGVLAIGTVLVSFRFAEGPEGSLAPVFVFISALVVTAGVLGINVGTRRAHLVAFVDRAARLERERDQQAQLASAAERARIAREMHDVVAHNLSVMIALADGAAFTLDRSPEQAASAINTVSATGREALAEMRRLLGVLRESDGSPARLPQPGLADVGNLVEQVRRAGLPVTVTTTGGVPVLPAGAQLTVYRLVQESLTNTLKHAGSGASARVVLDFDDRGVNVSVVDDGRGNDRAVQSRLFVPDSGPGQGISGMRARTAVYGGTVHAGARPGGGWQVRARVNATADAAAAEEAAADQTTADEAAAVALAAGRGTEAL